jgi:uncharacterized cofD-like protein
MKRRFNVVTIGGGTGTFVVLSGLKKYPINLSAIVSMMDSGGSAGRLRDQLGVLPPGDLRQALIALSQSEEIWRDLFTYRFEKGDLKGHTFGNIFLSSLEMISGSLDKSIDLASHILDTVGEVVPVTFTKCTLCARYKDGKELKGESLIDIALKKRPRITYMCLEPEAKPNPNALDKIKKADFIILGPGDLYTSTIPNLLVDGVAEEIRKSKAKKIYVSNLMTKLGETDDYKVSDHVEELKNYLGGDVDYIVVNTKSPQKDILDWYYKAGDVVQVRDDLPKKEYKGAKVVRFDVLSKTRYEQSLSDRIKRSLIRHDSDKLAKVLYKIMTM